jgi:hypothetical protein
MVLAGLVIWMLYTRAYWSIHAMHLALPPCPFLTITGHPCPFCGGTRSFAYTWNGDLGRAAQLYPLGPLMFAGTVVAIPVLAAALLTNRDLAFRLPERLRRVAIGAGLGVLAVSWALKLTVLPN